MLYYSHVNEDNRVERNILRETSCQTVVAVAGSGERVLSLMDEESCYDFHVVDVNPEALYLLELKLKALEYLYVEEYLGFIGHYQVSPENRVHWFDRIQDHLSYDCRGYWNKNIRQVENGVLNTGHFEKFLNRIRKPVNFFLGTNFKNVILNGYDKKKFPALKWSLIRRLFSARFIYKMYGNKDQAFTGKGAGIRQIPKAIHQSIRTNEAPSSFMMHLVFQGHLRQMKEKDLPPSLSRLVLSRVKQRLNEKQCCVHYHNEDLLSFSKKFFHQLPGPVFFSASDILSFEDHAYMEKLVTLLDGTNSLIVWRSFLRNRTDGHVCKRYGQSGQAVVDHSASESTGMYQVFSLKNKTRNAVR